MDEIDPPTSLYEPTSNADELLAISAAREAARSRAPDQTHV
jgi:hypothetical protein